MSRIDSRHAPARRPAADRESYRPRRPETTALYQVVARHLPAFLGQLDEDGSRPGLPGFVRRELSALLDCGILARGFLRVRCPRCREELLVAFSCKGRGFCPSCGGRRMADTAAHLVDSVLPAVPVRQWVLTLPFGLRFAVAFDRELCRAVRAVFMDTLLPGLRRAAPDPGGDHRGPGDPRDPAVAGAAARGAGAAAGARAAGAVRGGLRCVAAGVRRGREGDAPAGGGRSRPGRGRTAAARDVRAGEPRGGGSSGAQARRPRQARGDTMGALFGLSPWPTASSCGCASGWVPGAGVPPVAGIEARTTLQKAADLTGDGLVDDQDVELFEIRNGLSGELSAAMRAARR